MWLASPGCRLALSPHLEAMDHGGQGARTPTGHPQCEEVLGTHHRAWGVEGQPVGVSPWSCSFPGKWKGLLESPILPVAGSGPHRCQDLCVGQRGSGLWNVKHWWVHSLNQRSLVQASPERDARILRALDFGGRTTRKVYHQSPPSRDNSMPLAQGHSLASWLQKLSRKWIECPTPGFHVCGHSLSWGPTDLERGLPMSPLHSWPARQETWPSQGLSTAA